MTKNISRKVALGGITASLTALCLYAASIVPGGKLGFYFLSSFFPVMLLLEGYRGAALISSAAAGILMMFVLPDKLSVLPYVCFFGWYAVSRDCFIGRRPLLARTVLLIAFDCGLALWCLLASKLFGMDLAMMFGKVLPFWAWILIAIASQIVFLLYDLFFGMCVEAYRNRVHDRIFKR